MSLVLLKFAQWTLQYKKVDTMFVGFGWRKAFVVGLFDFGASGFGVGSFVWRFKERSIRARGGLGALMKRASILTQTRL